MGIKISAHDIREETRAPYFFLISSHDYWEDKQCTIESIENMRQATTTLPITANFFTLK